MSKITLNLNLIKGELVAPEIIGVNKSAELLQCSPNTVKSKARAGLIRFFWINHNEPGKAMILFKSDVVALQKKRIKEQQKKIDQMKGSKSE